MRIAVLLITGVLTIGTPVASAQDVHRPTAIGREEELWQQIVAKGQPIVDIYPFDTWFQRALQRRRELLEQIRLYLTLYPGGAHRDEILRAELRTRFDLAVLGAADFSGVCTRATELINRLSGTDIEADAAFWLLTCRQQAASAERAAEAPLLGVDDALLEAHREFFRRYPRSRHTPTVACMLFAAAEQAPDPTAMREILRQMRQEFPNHADTLFLAGRYRRWAERSEPVWPTLRVLAGGLLDPAPFAGHPVVFVVWAGFDAASRDLVTILERYRGVHEDIQMIGIAIDATAAEVRAAADELGVPWPQAHDGLGWGGEFVRFWGIEQIPCVMVLDASGCLAGFADADTWQPLLEQVLVEGPPTR